MVAWSEQLRSVISAWLGAVRRSVQVRLCTSGCKSEMFGNNNNNNNNKNNNNNNLLKKTDSIMRYTKLQKMVVTRSDNHENKQLAVVVG